MLLSSRRGGGPKVLLSNDGGERLKVLPLSSGVFPVRLLFSKLQGERLISSVKHTLQMWSCMRLSVVSVVAILKMYTCTHDSII